MRILISLFLILTSVLSRGQWPPSEMRGAWVATVENIDWPSKKTLTIEQQKKEFIALLDVFQWCRLNAVFVQIRPACDAFYPSAFDPYSHYLTCNQGKDPGYDPMYFMIEECHARGLEFHAWINPYRARQNNSNPVSENHICQLHPNWCFTYGNQTWLNPGIPAVADYLADIVKEICTKYAIDGIHFDDYFYPYPIAGKPLPDKTTWEKSGTHLSIADWRRQNVNSLIAKVSEVIKKENPFIKFGVSPFGVWRNESKDSSGSKTQAGITNYDDLYADALKWIDSGWVDYIAPQLYWEIGNKKCDYATLIHWWEGNAKLAALFPGLALYRVGTEKGWGWNWPRQIPRQIELSRELSVPHGYILYNSNSLVRNKLGVKDSIRNLNNTPTFAWTPNPDVTWKGPIGEVKVLVKLKEGTKEITVAFGQSIPHFRIALVETKNNQLVLSKILFPTWDATKEASLKTSVPNGSYELWMTDGCGRLLKKIWKSEA